MRKLISLLTAAAFLTACAPESFTALNADGTPIKKTDPGFAVQGCVPDSVDYAMQVNVISFAMTSTTEIDFGFNYDLGWFKGIELGADIKQGALSLDLDLIRPLQPSLPPVSVVGDGILSDNSFKFKVDTTIVKVGASHSSQTSLKRLAQKGFVEALKKANAVVAKDPNAWQTIVSAIDDEQHIRIPAGARAGVLPGDSFNIFDERWIWKGQACNSELLSHYPVSTTPIARAIVWKVEDHVTTLKIVGTPTQKIKLGDSVGIEKLWKTKKSDKRSLKKAVRLLPAYSMGKVVVNNLGEVDIPYYLNYVMPDSLNNSNFWISK